MSSGSLLPMFNLPPSYPGQVHPYSSLTPPLNFSFAQIQTLVPSLYAQSGYYQPPMPQHLVTAFPVPLFSPQAGRVISSENFPSSALSTLPSVSRMGGHLSISSPVPEGFSSYPYVRSPAYPQSSPAKPKNGSSHTAGGLDILLAAVDFQKHSSRVPKSGLS